MEIKNILDKLGLDFTNPETKRGALEAIEAILSSRTPIDSLDDLGGAGGEKIDVELDPDLIQPSIKQAPEVADNDIEIEDEEHILDQIKHNDSEDDIENNSSGKDSSESSESDSEDNKNSDEDSDKNDTAETNTKTADAPDEDKEAEEDNQSNGNDSDDTLDDTNAEDNTADYADDSEEDDLLDDENESDKDDAESYEDEDTDEDEDELDNIEAEDEAESDEDVESDEYDGEDDFEFDEDDLLDDEIADSIKNDEENTKSNARKIKRERTLSAAKKTLERAKTNKVAPALIRELEKAIEALEALTEAVTKNIGDISDEEFNSLINRVFDAIEAIGGSDLTYTTDKERELRAKEIKADLSKAETQNELSAEDVAQIRAEHQAVKAREKEASKYARRSFSSFKGFQDFLNSLYRAIALQVHTEETRDDSWSAISRRNSGVGVLRQGKKVNELPNKKIPIIDFYFDCSGSWGPDDIQVGKKAVSALADMEAKGQIKVNIYYFSDKVSQNYADVANGGTTAWNYIVKNIIATQATNVIIMTDWDMENVGRYKAGASDFLKYTVPGYVWYLWKNGENAPRLPRDLKGRGGTMQFSFNASDV